MKRFINNCKEAFNEGIWEGIKWLGRFITCPSCHGTGGWQGMEDWDECDTCEGEGKISIIGLIKYWQWLRALNKWNDERIAEFEKEYDDIHQNTIQEHTLTMRTEIA